MTFTGGDNHIGILNVIVATSISVSAPTGIDLELKVIPVSSSTGAGIQYLWEELNKLAIQTSKPIVSSNGEENPRAVREHVKAYVLRKREFLETKLKLTKQKKGTKKVFKGNQY